MRKYPGSGTYEVPFDTDDGRQRAAMCKGTWVYWGGFCEEDKRLMGGLGWKFIFPSSLNADFVITHGDNNW